MNLDKIFVGTSEPLEPIPTDTVAKLPKLPDIKAVLFDVYGTLIISGVGDISLTESENRDTVIARALASQGIGIPFSERAGLSERFRSVIAQHQEKERLNGTDWPEVDIRSVWRDFVEDGDQLCPSGKQLNAVATFYETLVNPVWPMPHLIEVMDTLRKSSLELGIVSNAQFFTPLMFEAFLEKNVHAVGFQKDLCFWSFAHLKAKPGTALYEKAVWTLGETYKIQAHEVLYVGNDMRNDIMPAQRVGMRTALFAQDKRSLRWRKGDTSVDGIEPDAVVTDLRQVLDIVGIS